MGTTIKSDTGIEVIIYNSGAGGRAPIHGAYLANQQGFKWIPWSWNEKGESFPLRVHSLDISLALASGEITVEEIAEEGTETLLTGS